MATIIFIHSFRGGTGKTTIAANLAALLAARGKKVGVVDTSLSAPGLHYLFGLKNPQPTLNDYLQGKCDLKDIVRQVEGMSANAHSVGNGSLFLIPASDQMSHMARIWHEGYKMSQLIQGLENLTYLLELDLLLLDAPPGPGRETLLLLEMADHFVLVQSPDIQDYRGGAILLEVAQKLETPNITVIVNKIPNGVDAGAIEAQIQEICAYPVTATLPQAEPLLSPAGESLFVVDHPKHPFTKGLEQVAGHLGSVRKSLSKQPGSTQR